MIAALLTLIIGVAVGWYAERVYKLLIDLRLRLKDSKEYREAGVVQPGVTPVRRGTSEPIDLSSPTGGVRRRSPDDYMLANIKDRDEKLRNSNL